MLDETKVLEADPTSGRDLPPGDESNSKPKHYTEKEHRKGIEDAIAQYGDKVKQEKIDPIAKERDTFKTQAEQAATSLEETKAKITDLEADLEQAIGEDADLLDIKKIKTELRTERDKARQEIRVEREVVAELKRATEAEREQWAGTVAEAQAFKFDGELAKLVDEYDGDVTANFNKLKTACEKAGIKTKEGAEAIAEILWIKKAEEPDLVDDSGVTTGGGTGIPTKMTQFKSWIAGLSQSEYEKVAPEVNKMMREGKIK